MLKATLAGNNGRTKLYLGLSFANLDRLRAEPMDTFIKIAGADLDLPVDVVIFSGRTEAEMAALIAGGIGPDTRVTVDPKLRQ
jgi:hypothetical protein